MSESVQTAKIKRNDIPLIDVREGTVVGFGKMKYRQETKKSIYTQGTSIVPMLRHIPSRKARDHQPIEFTRGMHGLAFRPETAEGLSPLSKTTSTTRSQLTQRETTTRMNQWIQPRSLVRRVIVTGWRKKRGALSIVSDAL